MASASYRFLSIPKGSFVFRFSPWMILSPSWEQSVDLMITDCRFRQCNKSLLKPEFLQFNLKQYWLGLWGNSSHEIASDIEVNMLFHQSLPSTKCLFHMSSEKDRVWFFLADFSSWTRLPLCEEAWGHPFSPAANKQPVTKAGWSVSTEILTTFGTRHFFWHSWGNFRWDWSKICYSIGHDLPWGVF